MGAEGTFEAGLALRVDQCNELDAEISLQNHMFLIHKTSEILSTNLSSTPPHDLILDDNIIMVRPTTGQLRLKQELSAVTQSTSHSPASSSSNRAGSLEAGKSTSFWSTSFPTENLVSSPLQETIQHVTYNELC